MGARGRVERRLGAGRRPEDLRQRPRRGHRDRPRQPHPRDHRRRWRRDHDWRADARPRLQERPRGRFSRVRPVALTAGNPGIVRGRHDREQHRGAGRRRIARWLCRVGIRRRRRREAAGPRGDPPEPRRPRREAPGSHGDAGTAAAEDGLRAGAGRLRQAGRAGRAEHARRAAPVSRRPTAKSARPRAVARRSRSPAARAGDRQPTLAVALRPRAGEEPRGSRQPIDAAGVSRGARLAGLAVLPPRGRRRPGVGHEAAHQDHHDVAHLPAAEHRRRKNHGRRSAERVARTRTAAPAPS